MKKYLITGANGQVGSQLVAQLNGKAEIFATDRTLLDITNRDRVWHTVCQYRPDFIINAAAYTAVDKAESEPDLAYAINCLGVENLALAANEVGASILHLSTDYVFDGKGKNPYLESDCVAPQNVYGSSKLAGEQALQAICSRYIILRTAWVFNEHGRNFVKTMLRLGASCESLNVVADQFGSPTYAGDIAAALLTICQQLADNSTVYGVYHFSGSPYVSWHGFATAIFAQAVAQGIQDNNLILNEISTSEYPTAAIRPANSCLDCGKIRDTFGIMPSDWQAALMNLNKYVQAA